MEYAGAGSFWSQLAAPGTEGDPLAGGIPPRRIDELLRSPISPLVDILLDEEAISEFRSANQKLISRVTSSEGLKLLVDVLLNVDVPEGMSDAHKLQLPFISAELIACEVDALLDGLVRVVPGQATPLERLIDFLIDHRQVRSGNSTILGYICRVIAILVTRRGPIVEKHFEDVGASFIDSLVDLAYDRSVADLILKLLIDDDMQYFPRVFSLSKLYSRWKTEGQSANPVVYIFDTLFCRMMIPSDRMSVIWSSLDGSFVGSPYTRFSLDILRILLGSSFMPHDVIPAGGGIFSEFTTPEVSSTFWEAPAVSTAAAVATPVDDDVVMGSDAEDASPKKWSDNYPKNIYTEFGVRLVDDILASLDSIMTEISSASSLNLDLSLSLLLARMSAIGVEFRDAKNIGEFCAKCMFDHPTSSAIHNAVTDLLVGQKNPEIVHAFIPPAVVYMENAVARNGGCYGHICRIFHSVVNSHSIPDHEMELIKSCATVWTTISRRLDDNGPSVQPSPRGIVPRVDEFDWTGGPRMYQAHRSLDDEDDTGL